MTAQLISSEEVFSAALRGEHCQVIGMLPYPYTLPVGSWTRSADETDAALLARCVGPTLDIGCGPGRMTAHLTSRGLYTLGVDVVAEAVLQTRDRGGTALLRDVFAPLPGEGRWSTALLADGNIGIGGDPVALLRRTATLITDEGRVVVDLAPPGVGLSTRLIRLQTGQAASRPFPWAFLGTDAVDEVAGAAGLKVAELTRYRDRWFSVLVKEG